MGTVPLLKSLTVEQRRPACKHNDATALLAIELSSSAP